MDTTRIKDRYEKLIENLKKGNWKDYFPQIIEDLDYIWNKLVEDIEKLSPDELIEKTYEIQESVILYFMELINIYYQEKYHFTLSYKIDELSSLGGKAAYDEKQEMILLSVIGILLEAINTSSYLQTILHEARHAYQHQFYQESSTKKRKQYPSYFYEIGKHYVLEKELNDTNFYLDNYNQLYPEVDAEENSMEELQNLLPYLWSQYDTKNELLEEKISFLQQIIIEDCEEIIEDLIENGRIYNQASRELYKNQTVKTTFLLGKEERNTKEAIEEYFKKHKNLERKYPFLRKNEEEPLIYQKKKIK